MKTSITSSCSDKGLSGANLNSGTTSGSCHSSTGERPLQSSSSELLITNSGRPVAPSRLPPSSDEVSIEIKAVALSPVASALTSTSGVVPGGRCWMCSRLLVSTGGMARRGGPKTGRNSLSANLLKNKLVSTTNCQTIGIRRN